MASMYFVSITLIIIIIIIMLISRPALPNKTELLETYIVHVSIPHSHSLQQKYYHSFLPKTARILHTYRHVMTGFAAQLTPHQLDEMSKKPGFLFARPHNNYTLLTTHTPSFLGLNPNHQAPWSSPSNFGKGLIIGLLDTGIIPAHPSFSDAGVPPPPPAWKGTCLFKSACNNKLIGARSLIRAEPGPPVDDEGHGTHTAATAAGNFAHGASLFGQANGTASGTAPLAHLSVYKVCTSHHCSEADIMAGIDAAIDDGVHVISISLGDILPVPFYRDGIAIGAFHAMEKGIFVSTAAGNSGPSPHSLGTNAAPWVLTVGASTTDRRILGVVKLGNGDEIEGETLGHPRFPTTPFPLVANGNRSEGHEYKKKIVLSELGGAMDTGENVVGLVVMTDVVRAYDHELITYITLPNILVSHFDGEKIRAYINSTAKPFATVSFRGTVLGADTTAPAVAMFSSRGPNSASPGILKPDVLGPGENILAAWHKPVGDSYYKIVSGTSMSCPHLSGIAALIKSVHPDWSPAMVKSAIMTTATQLNLNEDPIMDERRVTADVFAVGAGHVNPSMAMDPGLVYDIQSRDYVAYLCSLYDEKYVQVIVRKKIDCSGGRISEAELNYPSLAVELGNESLTYSRTVTNVGSAKATYNVEIESVASVNMVVEPAVLVFSEVNEKMTYEVRFSRRDLGSTNVVSDHDYYVQGSIAWVSANHKVRIPVSVHVV